jgi:hypothetical protein
MLKNYCYTTIILVIICICGCNQAVDSSPQPFVLDVLIIPEKAEYFLGERVTVRCKITNRSSSALSVNEKLCDFSSHLRICPDYDNIIFDYSILGIGSYDAPGSIPPPYITIKPNENLTNEVSMSLASSGNLHVIAEFENRYNFYEKHVFGIVDQLKDVQADGLQRIKVKNAWIGRIHASKEILVSEKPSAELAVQVKGMAERFSEKKAVSKDEIISIVEMAPGYVSAVFLKDFSKISKSNRAVLLDTLASFTSGADGQNVLRCLYDLYEKHLDILTTEEAAAIAKPLEKAATDGILVTDYEYFYKFKPDVAKNILAKLGSQATPADK